MLERMLAVHQVRYIVTVRMHDLSTSSIYMSLPDLLRNKNVKSTKDDLNHPRAGYQRGVKHPPPQ